jgi:ribosomal protein L14E/L6E/L27E
MWLAHGMVHARLECSYRDDLRSFSADKNFTLRMVDGRPTVVFKRTVKLGRIVSPALKEERHRKAVIVGIISEEVVLIQKKGCKRELCRTKELHLEEDEANIENLSPGEIDELIPVLEKRMDASNDFGRFKRKLIEKLEAEVLREMNTA